MGIAITITRGIQQQKRYIDENSKNNIKKRNTITREKIAWQWQL